MCLSALSKNKRRKKRRKLTERKEDGEDGEKEEEEGIARVGGKKGRRILYIYNPPSYVYIYIYGLIY